MRIVLLYLFLTSTCQKAASRVSELTLNQFSVSGINLSGLTKNSTKNYSPPMKSIIAYNIKTPLRILPPAFAQKNHCEKPFQNLSILTGSMLKSVTTIRENRSSNSELHRTMCNYILNRLHFTSASHTTKTGQSLLS